MSDVNRPLFDFRLRPLEQIEPWGAPEDPNLHWFALSDGSYWLNVGEQSLLEYSLQVQAEVGASRCCDYQVVRLHEDVLDMLAHVLDPVPQELREFIALKPESQAEYRDAWTSLGERLTDNKDYFDLLNNAGPWLAKRDLDTKCPSPSARITMWSDEREVHIQWHNRDIHWHGAPVWSASCGSFSLSHDDFVNEVKAFHWRFMHQMAERVADIVSNAGLPGIRIDLESLEGQQRRREALFEQSLQTPADAAHWPAVTAAVRLLEIHRKGSYA